ncbi:MAG TPA: ISAs1 family transposase [Stellaceae bacterium]|jgi:predicted transposase YbfD/YdcC|nr:ISAs1 family transposase [Stellaceae bacterium]
MPSLGDCFIALKDPRGPNAKRHDLPEILMIALCAVLAGGQTAVDMAVFAEAKQEFLSSFLQLRNGVPSHDTFSRVFRQLDPDQFRACFQRFMARFSEACTGVVAIDGKVLRRAIDSTHPGSALHMVSAWCCDTRLVLAQIATTAKANENTAVVQLLEMLRLKGTIVTTDALNCQRDIGRRIIEQGGDYVLALKGNHHALHADVARFFADPHHDCAVSHATRDNDHGRIETRRSLVSTDIEWLQARYRWPGLTAIGRVVRIRQMLAKAAPRTTTETAYYLLSSPLSAERLGQVVRSHWGVENRLHWVLNVVMNEDQVRSRRDNSPYNLAILRHMALNLMHKDRSKVSLRGKFNLAAWRDDFLVKLLAQA